MRRIVVPRDMNVVVASSGGVGTTFFLKYLAQHMKTNAVNDRDGLKHLSLPPVSFNPEVKFIYIYGAPVLATISLFRRNFEYVHSKKLQKWAAKPVPPIPRGMTLEGYASLGIDKFHFRNHFYNWHDKYLIHQTMFIKYEAIFDNVEPILEFLDIPKSHVNRFPNKGIRKSLKEDISVETRKQLTHMYGDFSDELARLDDVEIREPTTSKTYTATYLKSPYPQALIQESFYMLMTYLVGMYTRFFKRAGG